MWIQIWCLLQAPDRTTSLTLMKGWCQVNPQVCDVTRSLLKSCACDALSTQLNFMVPSQPGLWCDALSTQVLCLWRALYSAELHGPLPTRSVMWRALYSSPVPVTRSLLIWTSWSPPNQVCDVTRSLLKSCACDALSTQLNFMVPSQPGLWCDALSTQVLCLWRALYSAELHGPLPTRSVPVNWRKDGVKSTLRSVMWRALYSSPVPVMRSLLSWTSWSPPNQVCDVTRSLLKSCACDALSTQLNFMVPSQPGLWCDALSTQVLCLCDALSTQLNFMVPSQPGLWCDALSTQVLCLWHALYSAELHGPLPTRSVMWHALYSSPVPVTRSLLSWTSWSPPNQVCDVTRSLLKSCACDALSTQLNFMVPSQPGLWCDALSTQVLYLWRALYSAELHGPLPTRSVPVNWWEENYDPTLPWRPAALWKPPLAKDPPGNNLRTSHETLKDPVASYLGSSAASRTPHPQRQPCATPKELDNHPWQRSLRNHRSLSHCSLPSLPRLPRTLPSLSQLPSSLPSSLPLWKEKINRAL